MLSFRTKLECNIKQPTLPYMFRNQNALLINILFSPSDAIARNLWQIHFKYNICRLLQAHAPLDTIFCINADDISRENQVQVLTNKNDKSPLLLE